MSFTKPDDWRGYKGNVPCYFNKALRGDKYILYASLPKAFGPAAGV